MVASPFVKSQADHTLLPFRRLVSRAEFYLRPTEIYCPVRQDMGTFGSSLRVRLRKLSGRARALLENSSFPSTPPLPPPDSCLRIHVWCPTPRTRFINILNKIRENLNSSCGKGRLSGRKRLRAEGRREMWMSESIYTYITVSGHVHRWLCITCSYGRERGTLNHTPQTSRTTGRQPCGIYFRFMFPLYADIYAYRKFLRPNFEQIVAVNVIRCRFPYRLCATRATFISLSFTTDFLC